MTSNDEQFIQPDDHRAFLGASFVKRSHEIVLRVGTREWTRTELVQKVGIAHVAAAGRLSVALRKAGVKNMEQLYAIDPREFALIKGLGETTVFVAMAVLKTEGFDVSRWYANAEGARKKVVTFRTMKLNRETRRTRRRSA